MRTLSDLGVERDRIIFTFNKSDLLSKEQIDEKIEILNLKDNRKRITVSSKTGENVNDLKKLIRDIIGNQKSSKFKKEFTTYGH